MNRRLSGFLKNLIIYTVIIAIIAVVVYYLLPVWYYTPTFPFLMVLFFSVTYLVYYILVKVLQNKPRKFIAYFMLTTFVKFFFYLVIMVVYALINRDDATNFIVLYFILYMAFTSFEIISVVYLSKKQKSSSLKS